MHNMSWDDLRYVLEVARCGSVSRASQRIGVNHATVLRRVERFEEQNGVKIFARQRSGYTVLKSAEDIINRLRAVDVEVARLDRKIEDLTSDIDSQIRLTTTDTVAQSILSPALKIVAQDHPRLRVEVIVSNEHLDLARRASDITIRPAHSLPPDLKGEMLGILSSAAYGAPPVQELSPSAQWLQCCGLLERSPIAAWITENATELSSFRADSFPALAELAAAGLGVALLPTFLGDHHPGLVRYMGVPAIESSKLWLAVHHDYEDDLHSRTFMSALKTALIETLAYQDRVPPGKS